MKRGLLSCALVCGCVDGADPSGPLYCSSDAECPAARRCDANAHLCVDEGTADSDVDGPALESAVFAPSYATDRERAAVG